MSNILIIILKRWLYFLIWSSFNHYNISRCPIPNWNGISSQEPIWLDNKTLSFSPGLCYLTRPWGCTILAPSSDQGGIYFLRLTFAHLFWQPKLFSLFFSYFLTKTCWLSRCFLLVHTLALYQFSKLFPLSMKPRAVLYDSNFVFWKHWPSTCIINKNTIMDIAWHYHI